MYPNPITPPTAAEIEIRENGYIYFEGRYIGSYHRNKVVSSLYGLQNIKADNIGAAIDLVARAIHAKACGPETYAALQAELYGGTVKKPDPQLAMEGFETWPLHTGLTTKEAAAVEKHIENITAKLPRTTFSNDELRNIAWETLKAADPTNDQLVYMLEYLTNRCQKSTLLPGTLMRKAFYRAFSLLGYTISIEITKAA